MKQIGKITHFYDKLGVAIVELSGPLKVGERVRIVRNDEEFDQDVSSMQIEHDQVEKAKKGDVVGLKVDQKTKEGAAVYKLEEGE